MPGFADSLAAIAVGATWVGRTGQDDLFRLGHARTNWDRASSNAVSQQSSVMLGLASPALRHVPLLRGRPDLY
jgi:hypothetical protein